LSRQPADALVTIDGVAVIGAKTTLKPGRHDLEASAPGFKTLKIALRLEAGESQIPIRLHKDAPTVAPPPAAPAHRPGKRHGHRHAKAAKPARKKAPAPTPTPRKAPAKGDSEMLFD
jgi:hypothetical protein